MSNTPKPLKSFGGTQGGSSGSIMAKSLKNKRRLSGGSNPPLKGIPAGAENTRPGLGRDVSIGTVVMLDDQAFELVGTKPHIRVDGTRTELLVWNSECASCNGPFECCTPGIGTTMNRRCSDCKRPGKPVKGKRGRKVRVTVIQA